jgi:hypothetical protein
MMMRNTERSKKQIKKNVVYYPPILHTLAGKQTDKLNVYLVIG